MTDESKLGLVAICVGAVVALSITLAVWWVHADEQHQQTVRTCLGDGHGPDACGTMGEVP